jgi:molybdopterin synthase sulfur carrier subunit
MRVSVRYFASLREALGDGETVDLVPPASVGALRERLIEMGGRRAEALARGRPVRCAVDRTMCDESAPLHPGAEVAFFPPVTGG